MTDPDVSERFRELVEWLLRIDGKYGAKKRTAERLGIHATDIPKILKGDRRVGWDAALRAAHAVGIDPAYFRGTGSPMLYLTVATTAGREIQVLEQRPADERSLRDLRPEAVAVADAIRSAPPGYGRLPGEVREAARKLAEDLLTARLHRVAERLLALDPKTSAVDFDRYATELALWLVSEVPDNEYARERADELAKRVAQLPVADRAKAERDEIVKEIGALRDDIM